jgi:hypothetical protein
MLVAAAHAQTSLFNYQGQLSLAGEPANGEFDMRFTLHDTAAQPAQVGSALTNAPVGVTSGLFSVTLDFGSAAFNGGPRWLQIGIRPNGDTNEYIILSPRQPLTSTPYAIRSLNAGSASNLLGTLPATSLTGTLPDARLSPNVPLLNTNVVFLGSVTATQFNGGGAGLSNVPAAGLAGNVPDARLSTNVALLNSNAVFKASVVGSNFFGDGVGLTNVPGRIFEYIASATNLQATANFGYLATNPTAPVVVTLPATANIRVGETVRVTGAGAGGWVVAQNPGQVIQLGDLADTVGFAWRTNETARAWKAVAASADGSKLVAVVSPGNIHTSTNYGVNWTARATGLGNLNWSAVTSSADGTRLAACVNGGLIYTSTDSGVTWTGRASSGNRSWTGINSSLDGVRVVACASGGTGGIYISTDSGTTWPASPALGAASWTGIASSGNGVHLAATVQGGQIYTSTNSGVNWTARDSNRAWSCVASSADGSRLVAGVNGGFLHVSPDFGASWIPFDTSATWTAVDSSADGSRMIAVSNGGGVYVSMNSGMNWQLRANLPVSATGYTGAAAAGDGNTLVALATAQPIYISSQASTTAGTAGMLIGSRLSAVELQHVGNGVFVPITHTGTIRAK